MRQTDAARKAARLLTRLRAAWRGPSGPPPVFFLQVKQHFPDCCRAADAGGHGILDEPLSGACIKDGIAQVPFEDRELRPTSRPACIRTASGWVFPSSWRLPFDDRLEQDFVR